ncbi:DUF6254 family protein [Paenibacillus sp. N3.4]|nr:DUF6254 family protein [Paenibacillus sp. N3.4]
MSQSKSREEAAWKSRKQNQHPHGKVKSLAEIAGDSATEHTNK